MRVVERIGRSAKSSYCHALNRLGSHGPLVLGVRPAFRVVRRPIGIHNVNVESSEQIVNSPNAFMPGAAMGEDWPNIFMLNVDKGKCRLVGTDLLP